MDGTGVLPEASSGSQGVYILMRRDTASVNVQHGDSLFVPSFRVLDCSNFIGISGWLYRQFLTTDYIIVLKVHWLTLDFVFWSHGTTTIRHVLRSLTKQSIFKFSISLLSSFFLISILKQSIQTDLYRLTYNGVDVNLPYEEIYYLEKIDKMVYFHTKKGEFHQRINMSQLETLFSPYGFLRVHVSFLVNEKHIASWYKDEVELTTGKRIPLSRQQKRKISANKKWRKRPMSLS